MVKISTANTNLDGTGTLGTVITGASNGTLIKNVYIKATDTGNASIAQGMIRLFIYDGSANTRLLMEIDVPNASQSSTDPSWETCIPLNYHLKSGYVLKASTQNADNFNVVAEGLDYAYYATSVRPESTNYTANTGLVLANAANTALDGSGTVGTDLFSVVTAGASGSGWKGLVIDSINIKAIGDTTKGMIRIFIQNTGTGSSNTFLITEVFVPPVDASGTFQSFHRKVVFPQRLQIQAGYKIIVATQVAESFTVIADAMDWKYPS
ncbi:MAG TPA: hypothetical protein VD905_20870 [Flavobacteriales bacterium]|nr:hypothetical protein [Flavobacteriales bacterium]